jgi:hypothetical protein
VPDGGMTDHIVDRYVAGSDNVTGRDGRSGPLECLGCSSKIELSHNMEVGHPFIVGMPLLPCLNVACALLGAGLVAAAVEPAVGRWRAPYPALGKRF